MLAHHPTTGEPIRILRTNAQVSSSFKTLVWIKSKFQTSNRWSRWHCVASEPETAARYASWIALIVPANADIDDWLPVLKTHCHADSETLLLCPTSIVKELEESGFSYERTFAFEELFDTYPFLGEPCASNDPLEKIVVSVAHILRMNRIVWSSPERDDHQPNCARLMANTLSEHSSERDALEFGVRAQYDAWIRCCQGNLLTVPEDSDDSCIPRVYVIQQYFHHSSNRRHREIRTCLEKNLECPYIDNILLLNEKEYDDLPVSSKLETRLLGHRLTFYDVFTAIQGLPAGCFVIVSNSDIYFNDTLHYLFKIPLQSSSLFLAMLRWEDESPPRIFGPRADSQDAWILARDTVTFTPTKEEFGFPFGKPGCDNAIALTMLRKKYLVVNPAHSIQCMHLHSTNVRDYDPKDVLYRTHYLYVEPCAIQPSSVRKDLDGVNAITHELKTAWRAANKGQSFSRPIYGVEDGAVRTFCAMVRDSVHNYVANEANTFTTPPHDLALYNFKQPMFVTMSGLLSTFSEIFVGQHDAWSQGWEASRQSLLSQCLHVPHMISIAASEECLRSLSHWVLYYLPRVLQIRDLVAQANMDVPDFLVPQTLDIGGFLNDCVWGERQVVVVPMIPDMNYYSEDVWAMPPTSVITQESIARLRALLPKESVESTDKPVAVFCVEDSEDAVCTRGWAEEVVENLMKQWTVHYVSVSDSPSFRRKAFKQAKWILGSGDALDWMWYAPAGATLMEFVSDSSPRGDHAHLAGACGIRYIIGLTKKEPLPIRRQNALMNVGRALKKFGFNEMYSISTQSAKETLRVLLPSGAALQGLWSHTGDTFREMVRIWGERKYLDVVECEESPYVWWGGMGQVLLYDRPTSRWWVDVPSYQMALFGNCGAPGPEAHLPFQSAWSFWPRSPRAIEDLVAKHQNLRGYAARSIGSLFLGKIENGVQMVARLKHDWSKSVDVFSMPQDSTGAPYPYTQKEYLDLLCKARFGLCLPGYGPKCNREIEYFACGVVPIVTEGVDMTNYLVPPKEGVHYLRARTPADVPKLIKSIGADQWSRMSAAGRDWWSSYASAEGLFRLTFARIEQCRPFFGAGIPKTFP